MAVSTADAIAGGLLGVAAGDALGTTVEFMAPEEIRRRFGVHREIVGGGPFGGRPGRILTRWRDRLEYADRFMGAAAEIARIRDAR